MGHQFLTKDWFGEVARIHEEIKPPIPEALKELVINLKIADGPEATSKPAWRVGLSARVWPRAPRPPSRFAILAQPEGAPVARMSTPPSGPGAPPPCGVTSSERTGGMVRFGQVLWHRSGRGAGGLCQATCPNCANTRVLSDVDMIGPPSVCTGAFGPTGKRRSNA